MDNIILQRQNATIRGLNPLTNKQLWKVTLTNPFNKSVNYPYSFDWINLENGSYVVEVQFVAFPNPSESTNNFLFGWNV